MIQQSVSTSWTLSPSLPSSMTKGTQHFLSRFQRVLLDCIHARSTNVPVKNILYFLFQMFGYYLNLTKIWWIEKLLQTPIEDFRKFVLWRILVPYLINIRKCSAEEATSMIRDWLDKCSSLKRLDFSPNYMIKYNINSAKRNTYLPISLEKLKAENM